MSNDTKMVVKIMLVANLLVLDRFASPLAVRPKEASDGFHTIGDVMLLTACAHVVACATTSLPFHPMFPV